MTVEWQISQISDTAVTTDFKNSPLHLWFVKFSSLRHHIHCEAADTCFKRQLFWACIKMKMQDLLAHSYYCASCFTHSSISSCGLCKKDSRFASQTVQAFCKTMELVCYSLSKRLDFQIAQNNTGVTSAWLPHWESYVLFSVVFVATHCVSLVATVWNKRREGKKPNNSNRGIKLFATIELSENILAN